MCGIAGIAGDFPDEELISRMIEIIRHRGPDMKGFYRSSGVQFGYCRLAINDLSERANQPFVSPDQSVVVAVNGEIYNFKGIKERLLQRGYAFQSESDCEVVLHSYIDRGLEFISELNGMFAIAIWDKKKGNLFLIRDRLGIKPLYYSFSGQFFLFASEIKALAQHPEIDLGIDWQSFGEYLVFENCFGEKTLNRLVKLVEPGQVVRFDSHQRAVTKNYFWQPVLNPCKNCQDDSIYARYLEIVEASVERHLISDVPVGSYLSSGIDSSSVAYWASEKLNRQLTTYTGSFGMKGFYDEATDAKRIAEKFECANERVEIRPDDFVENIENVLFHLDEPRVGMGSFSQFMVAKRAARDVKVILTGHGGDEFFAGYPVFKAIYGRKNLFRLIRSSSPRELMFFAYFSLFPMLKKELRYFLPNIYSLSSLKKVLRDDVYDHLMQRADIFLEPEKLQRQFSDDYERLFLTYLRFYLPSLFIVEDKISMAFSLESRTPLCDNEVLEFAMRIPLSSKLKGFELKHVPRMAMKGKLPDFLYTLPKRGFPTPLHLWFKKELKDYVKSFILDNFIWLEFFRRSEVERLISRYQESSLTTPYDEIRAHRIWVLLNLVHYFRNQKERYHRHLHWT